MAGRHLMPSTKKSRRQARGERPRGIEKRRQTPRRSARLQESSLPSPPTTNPLNPKALHRPSPSKPDAIPPPSPPPKSDTYRETERKRKRSEEVEAFQDHPEKRPRADTIANRNSRRVNAWLENGSYPRDYFESGDKSWEAIKADTLATRLEADGMNDLTRPLLAKQKSAGSLKDLRRQALESSAITQTETIGDKSVPYRSPGYTAQLADHGSYLVESPAGITHDSELLCQTLLTTAQDVPPDTLFRDDLFRETCAKLHERNEARIVEDISTLIAPSAETLATYGATELKDLIFNVDERWGESLPITETRPQPDRCVGFSRSAFSHDQLRKLKPYIGSFVPVHYVSLLLATWRMYFPFMTCEAKSGVGELDVADKQNAHSMTMALRGIIELFKAVNREQELHRKILAFSISHDATIVKIYGHYALIEDRVAKYYRHPIRSFDFTERNGENRWTAYKFTKNVYFNFMPKLHCLICSAIDQLPLEAAPERSKPPSQIPRSDSQVTDTESEQLEMAASAPASQDKGIFKKPRLSASAILKQQNEELTRQLSERDDNASDMLKILQEELERQRQDNERLRQESKEQQERQRQEINTQLSERDGNASELLKVVQEELERQRQDNERLRQDLKEQQEQQRKEISKLTDTISTLAASSQKVREK